MFSLFKANCSKSDNVFYTINSLLIALLLSLLVVGDASLIRNLLGVVTLLYIILYFKKIDFFESSHRFWIIAIALFGAYHLLHILLLGDPLEHFGNYYKYLIIAAFVMYLSKVGFWLPSLYLGTAIGCVLTLYMGVNEAISTPSHYRIGIGHNPIVLATLLLVYIVVLIEAIFEKNHYLIKIVAGILVFGMIYLIVNTGVRGAYLTLLCLTCIYLCRLVLQFNAKTRLYSLLTFILISGLVLFFAAQSPSVEKRYERTLVELQHISQGDFTTSIGLRLNAWHVASAMIKEKPLFGYGEARAEIIEASHEISEQYDIEMNSVATLSHIHSQFLQIWVEYGIFGLACLLFVYVSFMSGLNTHDRWMFIAVLVIFLVLSLTDSGFKNNILVTAFFVVGSVLRVYKEKSIALSYDRVSSKKEPCQN